MVLYKRESDRAGCKFIPSFGIENLGGSSSGSLTLWSFFSESRAKLVVFGFLFSSFFSGVEFE